MGSCLVFCLIFKFFDVFFGIVFRIDFLDAFLTKNRSKLTPKLSGAPPFFDLFRGCDFLWYFCWFRVHFWRPFGTLWAHFGVLLAQIGSLLVPCRARFWLFCTLGCSFWFVVGEINLLRQYFAKNTPALTWHQISCKFFACKLSSLGPGAELLPQATEIDAQKRANYRKHRPGKSTHPKSPFWPKRSPRGSILEVFLEPFSIKNVIKNQSRNRYWKNMKKH